MIFGPRGGAQSWPKVKKKFRLEFFAKIFLAKKKFSTQILFFAYFFTFSLKSTKKCLLGFHAHFGGATPTFLNFRNDTYFLDFLGPIILFAQISGTEYGFSSYSLSPRPITIEKICAAPPLPSNLYWSAPLGQSISVSVSILVGIGVCWLSGEGSHQSISANTDCRYQSILVLASKKPCLSYEN